MAQGIREGGGSAVAVASDVTDPAQVDAAAHRAVDEFGGLDIAVANAGAVLDGHGERDHASSRSATSSTGNLR